MRTYTKVVSLLGYYFTTEFEKKKKNKRKVREIHEATVKQNFKKGKCSILVYFEERDEEMLITPDTDPDTIKRYLGVHFLNQD